MSDPTDTPSTDGAPDPDEVRIEPTFHKRTPDRWTIEVIGLTGIRMFSVEATGPDDEVAIAWANEMADLVFRPVVPEDRPAQWHDRLHDRPSDGNECGYTAMATPGGGLICTKCGWVAAGVPALDDDTRREVEALIECQTPHVCRSCEGTGWVDDEGWSHYGDGWGGDPKRPLERVEHDGLLICGTCDGGRELDRDERTEPTMVVDGWTRDQEARAAVLLAAAYLDGS